MKQSSEPKHKSCVQSPLWVSVLLKAANRYADLRVNDIARRDYSYIRDKMKKLCEAGWGAWVRRGGVFDWRYILFPIHEACVAFLIIQVVILNGLTVPPHTSSLPFWRTHPQSFQSACAKTCHPISQRILRYSFWILCKGGGMNGALV
jgi:hypothetical protein